MNERTRAVLTASGLGLFVLSSTAAGLCVSVALGCLALALSSLTVAIFLNVGTDPVIEIAAPVPEPVQVEPTPTIAGPTVAQRLREPVAKRGGRR